VLLEEELVLLVSLVAESPAGVEGAVVVGAVLLLLIVVPPEAGAVVRGEVEPVAGGVLTVTVVRVEDEAGGVAGAGAAAPGTTTVVGAVVDGTSVTVFLSITRSVGATTTGVSGWRVA